MMVVDTGVVDEKKGRLATLEKRGLRNQGRLASE